MRFVPNLTQTRMGTTLMPPLSSSELHNGCQLLIDLWSDSFVAGKHAYITEVIEGVTVSAKSFNDLAPTIHNLRVVNVPIHITILTLGRHIYSTVTTAYI